MTIRCNLIIDSCCDLPLDMVKREGVELMFFNYIVDGKVNKDDFYQSRTPKDFYDMLRDGVMPTTSTIDPVDVKKALQKAADSGVPTLFLCFSSGLSSNFDMILSMHEQMLAENPGAPVYVVDLLAGSTPEGIIVREALRLREEGKTAEELLEWALEIRHKTHVLFMVDDLDALHRGGRIPASVATVASALDLKPLLSLDETGHLALKGTAHGRRKGIKKLESFYKKNRRTENEPVSIGHADCIEDAERLRSSLLKENPDLDVMIHDIGPTIGSHVGANMIVIGFFGK